MTRSSSSTTDSEKARRGRPGGARRGILTAAAAAIAVLLLAQQLLTPKYMESLYEGAMVGEYYANAGGNDVVFIGDCEVYENFSPITLWEEYGIPSYIRGAPEQLIWQSYYVLKDTLRYETPDIVVLSILSMMCPTPSSEAYNRLNLDGLRLSAVKIGAIKASMTKDEKMLSYLFPLLRYHDRWNKLSMEDVRYFVKRDRVTHNGYYMRNDIKPVTIIPEGKKLPDYRFDDICYEYLDKIAELCAEKNIELILIKAPSVYPYWYPEWEEQISSYAAEHQLLYINFLEHTDEAGIDFEADTYDGGLHLNRTGAEKATIFLGQALRDGFHAADRRGDAELKARWDEKAQNYYRMSDAQYSDVEVFGEVRTFTY